VDSGSKNSAVSFLQFGQLTTGPAILGVTSNGWWQRWQNDLDINLKAGV
jgi:hypothetical protein